ncbi:hypothetical protein A2U01_0041309, partial [Trifolium medium]|jgi:ATP-binding cassette subfamily B (MDR/TAP) protein 1
VAFG